jgi:Domain of unknown function (DUF389)
MHRAMEITVPPATRDSLIEKLEGVDGLIGLSVQREPSIVPPGDVLTVHALNRDADRIMRLAAAVQDGGQTSVATHELSSIVDPDKERAVANDLDEALWEESETTLRHQGRVTANYLTLMALGGAVATTGFIVGSPSQAISVVAASVISPGFEPLAKVPMGLALRRWGVVGRGLWSAGVGCLVLALAFAALRATGVGTVDEFMGNSEIKLLENPLLREVLVSACGAVAGMTMVLLYRRYVITGALMALAVIPAAAMVGAALAAGKLVLAYQGAERFFLDVLLIIAGGVNVVLLKQTIVHRRAPMV